MANHTSTNNLSDKFKYWQRRTIIATMIGYALYYFVRKNLSMAIPGMQEDLGIGKADLGIFLTLHGLIYGVSKFVNGIIGDRVNARHFMVLGLLLSALCNVVFGFSSAVMVLGITWVLNGWFQGMGFPPCARLMTHWVPPQELATKMSVWNTSHSIGAGLVVIVCGYVVSHMTWRWAFFIPSLIAILGAIYLWIMLRDTPSSVGLPELHEDKSQEEKKERKKISRIQSVPS
ncbi:MFS transporter [Sphingobacterium sp. T2]|uniref:MFS transporter n=1 Tax=Sphingobacterium sp. T2 TaxID=1590596 RepID=UPI000AFBD5F6|nr:MFS transporter [Sphingobacterium sp. T2]